MQTVQNIRYLPENCSAPVGQQPPASLLFSWSGPITYQSGTGPLKTYTTAEGRLADWLRQAAQLQDPLEVLSYYLPLTDTGHSIHNERPALLSQYIALFLTGGLAPKEPPASTGPSTGPAGTRPAQTGTGTGVTGPAP